MPSDQADDGAYSAGDGGDEGQPLVEIAEAAVNELWQRGELAWKLRPYQYDLYDAVWSFLAGKRQARKFFADCHRRHGKSHVLFLIGSEVCRGKGDYWPKVRRTVRFAAPTMLDLEEIYLPIAEEIFDDCPDELRPVWQSTRGRGHFWFPETDSRLYLFGVDAKHYRKGRGKSCHLAVVDEAAACEPGCGEGIKHVVNSILLPQTFHVDGRIVMATTPPESPAHDSYALKADAQAAGTYYKRTLDDTASFFGQATVEEYERESGGRTSAAFRREYLCEWIVDLERAVIPEFDDELGPKAVREEPGPTFETPLVSLDVGFEDYSHALFGFYRFRDAKLIIQAETRLKHMRTDQLADAVKRVEAEIWPQVGTAMPAFGGERIAPKPLRISDVDPRLIADMADLHKLHFIPTTKEELETMVNEVRIWIRAGRILIHPRCQHLIRQLKSAIWNRARTGFERTSTDGHFDGVAALIYMVRNAPIHANPYPAFAAHVTSATHTVAKTVAETESQRALKQAFGVRRRRRAYGT